MAQLISIDKAVKTDVAGVLDLILTVVGTGPKIPYTYDPASSEPLALEIKNAMSVPTSLLIIEDPVATPIDEIRTAAKVSVVEFADWVTDSVISKYPKAEQMGWDRKTREATAFIAGSGSGSLSDAPTLTNLIQLQNPTATNAEIVAAVTVFATAILEKSAVLTGIADYIEILRKSTDAAIDAATTEIEIELILTTAKANAVAKTSAFGIILPS